MARKSITKSKSTSKPKVKKYQFAGGYNPYGQVQNPYYISGTYAEQAGMEADRLYNQAQAFGAYAGESNRRAAEAAKQRQEEEKKFVEDTNAQIKAANQQEKQAIATDALTQGGDLAKDYLKQRAAQKAAEQAATSTIANAAMQAGTAGTWAPIASAATPTAASVGMNALPSIGSAYVAPASTLTTTGTSLLPGAVEVGSQVGQIAAGSSAAAGSGVAAGGSAAGTGLASGVGGAAGTGSSVGAGLASAGIGLALNLGGRAIEKSGDDNDFRTFTKKEKNRNLLGSAMKSAGTGVGMGATIGSFIPIPGLSTAAGAVIGGLVGAGAGLVKGIKENKEAKKTAEDYATEQNKLNAETAAAEAKRQAILKKQGDMMAQQYNTAFLNSRLTGLQTGFGYNTSTNMNMQPTSSFYAKTGGKLPGGHIVPIGDDAVKFIGRKHSEGGIKLDPRTEVEGGETMDKVLMHGGKPNDYFFSAYLKLGGKSFAKRHEELVKAGAGQAEIQQLAKMQEAVANKKGEKDRGPEQIAKYGGIHRYQTAGSKEEGETVKSPESWEDIERVLPVPKEVNARYLEDVLSYCDQFPESQNCWNMPHVKGKDGETYIDVERYKKLPYVNQLVGALSSPAFRPGPDGKKIDLLEEIGSPMRLISRTYRNDIDESVYDVSARSGDYTTKKPQGFKGMGNPGDRVEIMTPQKAAEQGAQVSMPTEEDKARNERMKNFDKNYGPSTWVKSKKRGGVRKYQTGDVREEEALLGNEVELQGDAMGTWGTPVVREDLSGVKPTVKGGTSFEDAQKIMDAVEAGAIKEGDYKGQTVAAQNKAAVAAAEPDPAANPNKPRIYGMGRGDAASRQKYENAMIAPEDVEASRYQRFEREEGSKEGKGLTNYGWNNLPAGEKTPTNVKEATALFQKHYGSKAKDLGITDPKANAYVADYMFNTGRKPEDFLLYASGKISLSQINGKDDLSKEWNANKDEILAKINSGEISPEMLAQKRDDVARTTKPTVSPTNPNDASTAVPNPAYEATWKKRAGLILPAGYNDISGTKPPANAEQSANAQSNSNASNVTVRDQNQANAKAPSAQTSVAPGGTTNNAGQAAANAALFPEGRRAIKADEYGESTSMKGVPSGQKEGKVFFGDVTESEYESMKAANPWFDFSNFDPSKRDHKNPDGSYGSSDVYKFQKAYNEHVRKGEKLKEDGKFGEQTATSRLHVGDYKEIKPIDTAFIPSAKPELVKAKPTLEKKEEVVDIRKGINGSVLAGLGQLIPVGYALARPYKMEGNLPRMAAAGNVGSTSIRGALLPRVNMNAERAAAERNTVAIRNSIQNTNAGPGGIAAMMAANTAQSNQMLNIANQEQEANKQLAAEEARLGQQASMSNAEMAQRANMANVQNQLAVNQANLEAGIAEAKLKIDEKRYKREEILGALDTAASRFAGIVKDEKSYKAQERLAKAIDNTGSYDRFTIYEQLQKEAKKKDSPYYGKSDVELRKIASNTYNEVLGKMGLEGENTAKTGGRRKYTSRLGELSRNKKLFNI